MESHSAPLSELPVQEDEFAAGEENALNRAFFRLVDWLFRGPHFPPESIWFLVIFFMTDIGSLLISREPKFWVDPTSATGYSFVGVPLKWGGLAVLALNVSYIYLVSLILRGINRKLAFPAWCILCVLHTRNILSNFACWNKPLYDFLRAEACSYWYAAAILILGILWAFAVLALARSGVIPLMREPESSGDAKRLKSLRLGSLAWISLLAVGVLFAATGTKPEWKQIEEESAASARPSPRMLAALAYDPNQQVAIMFGGNEDWTPETDWPLLGDTWQWDGENWKELNPASKPSSRRAAVIAYDAEREVMVLFGGIGLGENNSPIFFGDTWEWDGENWIEKHPEISPPARGDSNLYYDSSKKKIFLYGGWYGNGGFFDDLWEWDGESWSQITLEEPMVTSSSAILYYEPELAPILLDGWGLWSWRDSSWQEANDILTPSGRWSGSLAYDHQSQQVVMFGGYHDQDIYDETWVYDGSTWEKLVTKNQPLARYGSNMFFDFHRNRVVLFGGYDGANVYNDQWELVLP